jgi:hypothetical protein
VTTPALIAQTTILPQEVHDTIDAYYIGAPRDFLVRLALMAFDAGRKSALWTCGCGTTNGTNLATCRVCNRREGEKS